MQWRLVVLALSTLALTLGLSLAQSQSPLRPNTAIPRPVAQRTSSTPEPLLTVGDNRPRWKERWTRQFPAIRSLSLAPDGAVALLDDQKQVQLLGPQTGTPLWTAAPLPLVNHVVAVRGRRVLVGALYNPSVKKAWILGPTTTQPYSFALPGTLWSLVATPDGNKAFFGTSANQILATSLVSAQPPLVWKLNALPDSLAVSTDGSAALTGTWLPAGVRRLGGWAYGDSDTARWQEVQISADGATAISLSGHGPRRDERNLELTGYDMDSGMRLWEKRIPGTQAQAIVSADGQRVALSYVAKTARGDETKRLVLLNRDGTARGDEKGGRFFAPRLVALSAQGERTTALDGERALFVLDQDGKTRWRLALPAKAPIQQTISTSDGAFLLLVRTNGTLTLYEALP